MSTSMAIRHQTFLAEGRIRYIVLGTVCAAVIAYLLVPEIPNSVAFDTWMTARAPVFHGTVLAVFSAFVAALLTIWTLMKTRSTRYIERLADSRTFADFIGDFEGRLVFGAFALLLTAVVAVAGWAPEAAHSFNLAVSLVWIGTCIVSATLLIDSLLTARVLL